MANIVLNNMKSVSILSDNFVNNAGNDLVDVNVYKGKGSFIGHFDLEFLINLLKQISESKGYNLDIDNLKRVNKLLKNGSNCIQYREICMLLATELAYKFNLFVKYLSEKGISDFDWFYSFKDEDSMLVIYGINNVISELCKAISLYCERINNNELKQYFSEQLKIARLGFHTK